MRAWSFELVTYHRFSVIEVVSSKIFFLTCIVKKTSILFSLPQLRFKCCF